MKSLKIKAILIAFTLLSFSSVSFARAGGDLINNGGGLGEKNVLYAYERLENYIQLCLNSNRCKLDSAQKAILIKIVSGLSQDKNFKQLIFASESKQPGFFLIDGNVRIAKTGSFVGSPIYINSDLLSAKNKNGEIEVMTIPEAVAVLVHEFGHHYGNYSHEELDFIGVRVSLLLQTKVISTPMIPWQTDISLNVLNQDEPGIFPEILLYVGGDIIDISAEYKSAVRCNGLKLFIPIIPIPDISLTSRQTKGSILHNLHWDKINEDTGGINIQIIGNVSNRCDSQNNDEIRNNSSQISIKFRAVKIDGQWKFQPETFTMNQFEDQWWKIIKLPN